MAIPEASPLAGHWTLDPEVLFLNHGSFGACPRPVLAAREELVRELERQPVAFLIHELPDRLDAAREALARFVKADPLDLAWVSNATTGVNTVLRSLTFEPGDELLTTDHAYNACRNALEYVAGKHGARVVVASVPFPLQSPGQVTEAVLAAVTPRTRLALIDHVTSPTGLIFPVEEIVRELSARGIDSLVDGAHAPGMLDLDVESLGAAYYTGNCHKWMCAPKGAGFLYVRRDLQAEIRPLVISHGANRPRPGRSRFHDEMDWTGTIDPTSFLCVPAAIETMAAMVPGGWDEVRRHNRALALEGRKILAEALGTPPPAPEEMIGTLVAFPIPDGSADPLHDRLLSEFRTEIPVFPWPAPPQRLIRISAQLYNSVEQYRALGQALRAVF
jgi:isopenicillin-N epimerase